MNQEIQKEKWIAVVGLVEEKPYEIFTGRADEAFIVPDRVTHGWVIKSKTEDGSKRYDFRYVDRDGYKVTIEGLSRCFRACLLLPRQEDRDCLWDTRENNA